MAITLYRQQSKKINIEQISKSAFLGSPEIGSIFTAKLDEEPRKRDYVLYPIKNWTGYVKLSPEFKNSSLTSGKYYRFIVTAVHSKNHHNYYYAIPFRKLNPTENTNFNYINPEQFLKIKRLAEKIIQNI